MTIPEAASLVLQASTFTQPGRIFVLDMGTPVKIDDLARNMIRLSGLKPDEDEGSKVYYCSDTDCNFCLWKDNRFLESMKKTMTKDMAIDLLTHGRTYVKGLYSKKRDKCFSADLVMEVKDGKVNYALEFPKSQGRK